MRYPTSPIVLAALALALVLSATVGLSIGCNDHGPEVDLRGVFVRAHDAPRATFVPWQGEQSVQGALNGLVRDGGGEVHFAPGDYDIEVGFQLNRARQIRISGSPGTTLRFLPDAAFTPGLTKGAQPGDTTLTVDDARGVKAGHRYQLYPKDLKGDRLLELTVTKVDGNELTLSRPVAFMGHVQAIPVGSALIDDVCFFRVMQCDEIEIEGLTLDGLGRGRVHGHTTFCGVYVVGVHRPGELPTSRGLRVRNCKLSRLQGRGVCVYSMAEVLVEGCSISGVDSQAIELDHFTTGRVIGNDLSTSGVGVALNDAFASVVERNTIVGCAIGVAFVRHFSEAAFNVDNVIQENIIVGATGPGVDVQSGIKGNVIRGNWFADQPEARWIRAGDGNQIEGNRAFGK